VRKSLFQHAASSIIYQPHLLARSLSLSLSYELASGISLSHFSGSSSMVSYGNLGLGREVHARTHWIKALMGSFRWVGRAAAKPWSTESSARGAQSQILGLWPTFLMVPWPICAYGDVEGGRMSKSMCHTFRSVMRCGDEATMVQSTQVHIFQYSLVQQSRKTSRQCTTEDGSKMKSKVWRQPVQRQKSLFENYLSIRSTHVICRHDRIMWYM
jgi:hypothetical protein